MRSGLLIGLLLAGGAGAQIALVPPSVPPGFAVDILSLGVTLPTGLAFLPDGRILVSEQASGAIKVWAGGAVTGTVGIIPGVNSAGFERGLLGIAVDPGWPARPYLYAWFNSTGSPIMRLSMYKIAGDLATPTSTNLSIASQYDIRTDVPDVASIHNGGSLRFGPDGMLYLSIGDDAIPCAAQDINSGVGCIVRMDVSALPLAGPGPPPKSVLIPSGNPFAGPTDNARLVWAYGLRNPFRFHVDPLTGKLMIAEVGAWLVDEIDDCTGGENFGWPWYESTLSGLSCAGGVPTTVHPVASLPHTSLLTATTAIMSGGLYRNVNGGTFNLGAAYEGDYFFLEYFSGAMRRLHWNGSAWGPATPVAGQSAPDVWATGFQSVVDTAVGPDGALYFVKQYHLHSFGAIGRIRSDPNAVIAQAISGNHQTGNPGANLASDLVVRVTTPAGAPVVGVTVQFVVAAGGGTLGSPTAVTNAQGDAATSYALPLNYTQNPIVAATVTGGAYAVFDVIWRGISVDYAPAPFNQLSAEVRHSETNSPFTLVWEPPAPMSYGATPFGDLWTSVLGPGAPLGYVDGLGLFGPPDAAYRTGPSTPFWTYTLPNPPLASGTTLLFQAYAIDTARYPAPDSIMISNPEIVTIP